MSNPLYDFKEQAIALIKQLRNPSAQANPELMRAAVEVALRDAHAQGMAQGMKSTRGNLPGKAPQAARPASSHSHRPSTPPPSKHAPSPRGSTQDDDCPHQWRESFLDGKSIGNQCAHCGAIERETQDRCEHFFVKNGSIEVCVACRATRKLAGAKRG